MPTFPTEIFENIIDCASNERKLLRACALVCRSWLPRSRVQLYYSIDIARPVDLDRFVALLDRSPHIAFHVHVLVLWRMLRVSSGLHHALAFADKLVDKLPQLKTLSFMYVGWESESPSHSFFSQLSNFTSVTRLELHGCRFESFSHFQQLVDALGQLTALTCDLVGWDSEEADEKGKSRANSPNLTYLKFVLFEDSPFTDTIATWFSTLTSNACLQTIYFRLYIGREIEERILGNLLETAGANLYHVTIDVRPTEDGVILSSETIQQFVNLSHNRQLQTVELLCEIGSTDARACSRWLYMVLFYIESRNVRSVLICIDGLDFTLERIVWDRIDQILSSRTFASLNRVVVCSSTVPWRPTFNGIRRLLPLLRARKKKILLGAYPFNDNIHGMQY